MPASSAQPNLATTRPSQNVDPGRWRLLAALIGLGLIGIAGGLPLNLQLIAEVAPDEPLAHVILALTVGLLVQVSLASLVLVTLGPRVGLGAPVLTAALSRQRWWPSLRGSLPIAAGLALGGFVVVLALDLTVFDDVRREISMPEVGIGAHLLASLYGGIVEELLIRAGLMTLLAWLLVRITRIPIGTAPTWVVWTSIMTATVAFGLLHLPATAVMIDLTPMVIARALLLNAPFAIVFGWLTWRRGLEAAIASHIVADILLIAAHHVIS
jgi:hypothetical protein